MLDLFTTQLAAQVSCQVAHSCVVDTARTYAAVQTATADAIASAVLIPCSSDMVSAVAAPTDVVRPDEAGAASHTLDLLAKRDAASARFQRTFRADVITAVSEARTSR